METDEKRKTKDEEKLEDCAWNLYKETKEEEDIQNELLAFEYSPATILPMGPLRNA